MKPGESVSPRNKSASSVAEYTRYAAKSDSADGASSQKTYAAPSRAAAAACLGAGGGTGRGTKTSTRGVVASAPEPASTAAT